MLSGFVTKSGFHSSAFLFLSNRTGSVEAVSNRRRQREKENTRQVRRTRVIVDCEQRRKKKGRVLRARLSDAKGQTPLFPRIFGHEAGGIVDSVGEGVTDLSPGDHVLPVFTGECKECGHCELHRSVHSVSYLCSIFQKKKNINQTLALEQKLAGASRIIGVDLNSNRFETAKKFGVTEFVNHKDHNKPVQVVLVDMTNGGVDRSIECTGNIHDFSLRMCSRWLGCCGACGVLTLVPHTSAELEKFITHTERTSNAGKWVDSFGGFPAKDLTATGPESRAPDVIPGLCPFVNASTTLFSGPFYVVVVPPRIWKRKNQTQFVLKKLANRQWDQGAPAPAASAPAEALRKGPVGMTSSETSIINGP
ncbi:hypothetical protein H6P81_001758 [Aristolochia fimbriata]|uniref:Alcohol dehydrogenase 1 n=1 Tax=Aristolochia fimbriata TaxID=158543 RepID=A0AAV7F7U3_ARIFI|nr:hypothetical protein H6P81_001758 [Aristolochia fimbriata]